MLNFKGCHAINAQGNANLTSLFTSKPFGNIDILSL